MRKILTCILNKIFSVNPKDMIKANELHWILKDILEAKKTIQQDHWSYYYKKLKPITDQEMFRIKSELCFNYPKGKHFIDVNIYTS